MAMQTPLGIPSDIFFTFTMQLVYNGLLVDIDMDGAAMELPLKTKNEWLQRLSQQR